MNTLKKTKIIITLGPAITKDIFTLQALNDPQNADKVQAIKKLIGKLYDYGVNVIRLNFSHGSYEEHYVRLKLAREVALAKNVNVSAMLDTKGPEIRVYKVPNGAIEIQENQKIRILTTQQVMGDANTFAVYDASHSYNMAKDVKVGSKIYVDDGKLNLLVEDVHVEQGYIDAKALNTFLLKDNKRINLPDSEYTIPFLSTKDEKDIMFAIKYQFDYIAASFVNHPENVQQIRALLHKHNANHIQIVSKIESSTALKNLEAIVDVSDAIMIARGDLGLEVPYYEIPVEEKRIIKYCRYMGKNVIVATQMLDSLENKLLPTRAEVTDVFFAVERGTDATMLSGETANGLYPDNTVHVMSKICLASENFFDYDRAIDVYFKNTPFCQTAVGRLAVKIAKLVAPQRYIGNNNFEYCGIYVFSNDPTLVTILSNLRCAAPIFLITDQKAHATAFGLHYGVYVKIVADLAYTIRNHKQIVSALSMAFAPELNAIIVINDHVSFT